MRVPVAAHLEPAVGPERGGDRPGDDVGRAGGDLVGAAGAGVGLLRVLRGDVARDVLDAASNDLALGAAAEQRPVVTDDGALDVATVMTMTLSSDHRVIDGSLAAEFMQALKTRLENPVLLAL